MYSDTWWNERQGQQILKLLALSVTEEVSLEIRYRVVKRAATLATGPRPQKLAADRDS